MKKLLAIFTVITMTFTGCSIKSNKKTADEMPSDKPYNRMVLETENGYYYQVEQGMMSLRYTEKSNGTDIFLCAKPECQHSGEQSCTATYNFYNISNYVLYDGFIYFVADDSDKESFAYSLYKVSLDGSSLDKVAEIIRVKNSQSNDNRGWGGLSDICIHKGYAYIPYQLGQQNDYAHYVGKGFARVNLQTGESELLFSHDDFMESTSYMVECGIGDYVYYYSYNDRSSKFGYYRYNIKNGTSEEISGELGELLSDTSGHSGLAAITENTIYLHYYDGKKETLTGYDVNTFKKNDFEFDLTDGHNIGAHKTMFYDNKIFVVRLDKIDVYTDTGELLGSHPIPSYLKEGEPESPYNSDFRMFDISNDKVYMAYYDNMTDFGIEFKNGIATDHTAAFYSVYSCSIEDIINGKGDWEKQYSIKNPADYWNENVEIRPANSY